MVGNKSRNYPKKLASRKLQSFILTENNFDILDNKRTKLFSVLACWTKIGLIY